MPWWGPVCQYWCVLLPVVGRVLHPHLHCQRDGEGALAYEEQPIGPGPCAGGLCWGRLAGPLCAQTEQSGDGQ